MIRQQKDRNVAIYQPIIAPYRVPLFNFLARQEGLKLVVFASNWIRGLQASARYSFEFKLYQVAGFGLGRGFYFQSGIRIPGHFKKGDVVVLSGMPKFLNLYPLITAAKARKIGIVWWGHGFSTKNRKWSVYLRQHLMKFADVLLLYTDKEAGEYLQKGFKAGRIFATNNTIDPSAVELAREEWNSQKLRTFQNSEGIFGKKNVVFSGRLTAKARLDIAIDAFCDLIRIDPDYRLIIIGDGVERNSLVAKAKRLQVQHAIKWVGSLYDDYQLAPWFLSAFVFIYPGNIGLSLLHAFAFGLPVITHDRSGLHMPEFAALQPGENGLVYRHEDHRDLARKICDVSRNSNKAVQMGQSALRTIQNEYSFQGMVNRFCKAVLAASEISLTH